MKQVKIVVTGGPSGGKTTLIEGLKKELGPKAVLIPEAASILYRGGFPRLKTGKCPQHTQKSIYFVQQELETMLAAEAKKSPLVVCDRGSLDAIAYWPRSEADFFKTLKTTRAKEIRRYDWVLHLDTAAGSMYDVTNPLRTETHAEADKLNEKIKRAWRGHPRRFIISQNEDFMSKMTLALTTIQAILDGRPADKIRRELFKN